MLNTKLWIITHKLLKMPKIDIIHTAMVIQKSSNKFSHGWKGSGFGKQLKSEILEKIDESLWFNSISDSLFSFSALNAIIKSVGFLLLELLKLLRGFLVDPETDLKWNFSNESVTYWRCWSVLKTPLSKLKKLKPLVPPSNWVLSLNL